MFDDLDKALERLIDDPTQPPSMASVDVSFKPPDKTFNPNSLALNIFRIGVRENRVLRDPVPIFELVGGSFVRRMPPLRVDCDFLVTAWSKKTDALATAEEGLTLANALVKLARHPTIPAVYLQGSLANQPFPVQMWVAQADEGKSLGEFWTALGISPRSSFHLTVTIAMNLAGAEPEGPPVVTREIRLDDDLDPKTPGESCFAIGGVVRDAASLPVEKAVVTLDGGASVKTKADGRFSFAGVGAGHHVLHAVAESHPLTGITVTVPAAVKAAYDIQLPP